MCMIFFSSSEVCLGVGGEGRGERVRRRGKEEGREGDREIP